MFVAYEARKEAGILGTACRADLIRDAESTIQRLALACKMPVHGGCVNTITWSDDGKYILSGSDDQYLVISDPFNPEMPVIARIPSGHNANIFSAKFLPSTRNGMVVSCAGDGTVILTDVHRSETHGQFVFRCHTSTTYEVATIPNDSFCFLSCGEDGCVRLFDRRLKTRCIPCTDDVLLDCRRAVNAIDVNKQRPFMLAVGCSDSTARIYDMRMLSCSCDNKEDTGLSGLISYFCVPETNYRSRRVTSMEFSADGSELLASFSSGDVYLIDVDNFTEEKAKLWDDNDRAMSVKKVRLRGDWSDTGPQSRPQHDATDSVPPEGTSATNNENLHRPAAAGTIMQRFTNLLSHWLERQIVGDNEEGEGEATPEEQEMANVDEVISSTEENVAALAEEAAEREVVSAGGGEESTASSGELGKAAPALGAAEPTVSPADIENVGEPSTSTSASGREVSAPERNVDEVEVNELNVIGASPSATDCIYDPVNHSVNVHREEAIVDFAAKIDVKLNVSLQGTCCSVLNVKVEPEENEGIQREGDVPSTDANLPSTSAQPDNTVEEEDEESKNRTARRRAIVEKLEEAAQRRQQKRQELLAKLQDMAQNKAKMVYSGHRNARTMLKQAVFWGHEFIMSGSDCGHIFVWRKDTGKVIAAIEGDKHVVNCLQPHPYYLYLASSGIDHDVKFWAPTKSEYDSNEDYIKQIVERNRVMLEETKDIVTVPAAFMIRMLASMNRFRQGGGAIGLRPRSAQQNPPQEEDEQDNA